MTAPQIAVGMVAVAALAAGVCLVAYAISLIRRRDRRSNSAFAFMSGVLGASWLLLGAELLKWFAR